MMLDSPKDERFAQEYVKSNNASEAWRKATGKVQNSGGNAAALLKRPEIKRRIIEIRSENEKKLTVSKDQALEILSSIALAGERDSDKIAALKLAGQWTNWETGNQAENKVADTDAERLSWLKRVRGRKEK